MTEKESFEVAELARTHFRAMKESGAAGTQFDSWVIATRVVHPRLPHLDAGDIEEIVRLEGMALGLVPIN